MINPRQQQPTHMAHHFERINDDQITRDEIDDRIRAVRWARALVLTAIVVIGIYGLAHSDPMGAFVSYQLEQGK